MPNSALDAFKKAVLHTDDSLYSLVHLPAPAIMAAAGVLAEISTPFSALIVDKDEVSLVVSGEYWDEFAGRLPEHRVERNYRLITFDQVLGLDMVGFMALVGRILADAGISILPYAAFERDHILVREDQFQIAWDTLHHAQKTLALDSDG
jgi:hypothetical protein